MQTTTKTVRVIPATKGSLAEPALVKQIKKRVCAYARVSTDSDEQQTSYEAQVDHYTRHIQSNDQWIYCGVYADDGVSATSTKKRNGFNQMISDALDGKVDLIITKSVSRFARNTVDTLTTVRKLKEKGVEVFFQKENIYTLDSKGELLITIMSSLAQEESRSISENVTWGVRKRFSDGKVSMPYKRFLGYEKGPDGTPAIVEEEARLVRIIYRLFLFGKSPSYIASFLTEEGIPTPSGKEKWHPTVIISILTNEKYRGDALLQKRITVDFLTKTQKLNEGEAPQYLVHNSHPAIVEPEVFDLVQHEISRRRTTGRWGSSVHPFSGKIVCGCCGQTFGSKVWHSTSEYRRLIWRCNKKYEQAQPCDTPHLSDDQIKAVFLEAFNQRLTNKAEIISSYDDIIQALADTTELDAEESALLEERDVVMELKRKCIQENAASAQDQEDYRKRYDALHQRHENASARLAEIETIRLERNAKRINITRFLNVLARQGNELVKDFDEELWYIVVDSVTVHADGKMAVKFRDEEEILIAPSKWKSA